LQHLALPALAPGEDAQAQQRRARQGDRLLFRQDRQFGTFLGNGATILTTTNCAGKLRSIFSKEEHYEAQIVYGFDYSDAGSKFIHDYASKNRPGSGLQLEW